jgi:hypothetical protein
MADSDDEEVFEINDFTNATPWERSDHIWYNLKRSRSLAQLSPVCLFWHFYLYSFIADIEKIIRQWGLSAAEAHEDVSLYINPYG